MKLLWIYQAHGTATGYSFAVDRKLKGQQLTRLALNPSFGEGRWAARSLLAEALGQSRDWPAWDTTSTSLPWPCSQLVCSAVAGGHKHHIKGLAFVFRRLIVSWMLIFVMVPVKVIKKHSLISCSMAWIYHPWIFLSYKHVVSELHIGRWG